MTQGSTNIITCYLTHGLYSDMRRSILYQIKLKNVVYKVPIIC